MRWHTRSVAVFLYVVDLALVLWALKLADLARHRIPLGVEITPETVYVTTIVYFILIVLWSFFSRAVRLYDIRQIGGGIVEFARLTSSLIFTTLLFGSLLYFIKLQDFSRLLVGYFAVLSWVGLVGYRLLLRWLWKELRTRGYGVSRVLIVGTGPTAEEVARALQQQRWSAPQIVGFVDAPGNNKEKVVGTLEDTPRLVEELQVNEVIIALPPERREAIVDLVMKLRWTPVRVKLVPDLLEMATIRATVDEAGGMPLIELREPMIGGFDATIKRTVDILVAGLALLLLWPLMLFVALLLKLDSPGPVIYRQERIGENGKPFQLYKFRSMVVNAEELLHKLIDLKRLEEPVFKIRNDPRVTRVGRIIRRLSLDELPQLWNVLKGDMSLVGPRPEETQIVKMYSSWHLKRLAVKPGITGPMQVSGRGELSLNERMKLELAYIENYSLWEDIKILGKTFAALFSRKGSF